MKLYSTKQKWKLVLAISGIGIIVLIFWFSSYIVSNVKTAELEQIKLWSEAIKKKASLVKLTNEAFGELSKNEREKVFLWARATKEFQKTLDDYGLALDIIQKNKNIPLILTDENSKYVSHLNVDILDVIKSNPTKNIELRAKADSIKNIWKKQNSPIEIKYSDNKSQKIYYSNSKKYFQLQHLRDSLLNSFSDEIMNNIALVPVVFYDTISSTIIASNIISPSLLKNEIKLVIDQMKKENSPIYIDLGSGNSGIVYYNNSKTLFQLQYFPIFILITMGIFALISYILFSTFRKAEQNQVWAGMAKETAHQLGTPLSSLQGWIEILREKNSANHEAFLEMEKDVKRLTVVSERFSKIGSKVKITPTDLNQFINSYMDYMQKRLPKTVNLDVKFSKEIIKSEINPPLFSWVLENILKNAADAMGGKGNINLSTYVLNKQIVIDISDDGKGIPSSKFKTVFEPGYTTKGRGWGLGLSLAKRIIEGHHGGKINVKASKINLGTTIEIMLPLTT
jgi:two-component system, sporulation sensor kinase D